MEGMLFGLAGAIIYFGFLFHEAATGEIHLRGGVVIRRRDSPAGFWLVLGFFTAWGGMVVVGIASANMAQIAAVLTATTASLHF